jgi:acetoin utilization deacetylase AcuC-like enzyme
MPALDAFRPDLILISAGFDAHRRDPLAHQSLEAEDFAWATRAVLEVARRTCAGKVVSALICGTNFGTTITTNLRHCTRAVSRTAGATPWASAEAPSSESSIMTRPAPAPVP